MVILFLDSNIIVKYYYTEPGSTWVRQRSGLFLKLHLNSAIFERAAELALNHPIKGYDAIQVASALSAKASFAPNVTFVSGDQQALVAAEGNGLITDDPFKHVVKEDMEHLHK